MATAMSDDTGWKRLRFAKSALKRLRSLALACPAQLEQYLTFTVTRLANQGKVVFAHDAEGDFAVFNTGLVDSLYESVYCVCVPVSEDGDGGEWRAKAFCTRARSRYGRRVARVLGERLPECATYFESDEDMVAKSLDTVEADCGRLVMQLKACVPDMLHTLGVTDDVTLEHMLHDAMRVAAARARRFPSCAVPAWGEPVDVEGVFFCLPLSLGDYQHADVVGVLQAGTVVKLIRPSEALLCAWLVRMPDAGLGWVMKTSQARPVGQSPTRDMSPRVASTQPANDDARARLTCTDAHLPAYVVHSGDVVGISRRNNGARPNIVLPSRRGFEGVSQVQGRFVAHGDDMWEFVHEGSNWTLVRHVNGIEKVLRTRGAKERVHYGDSLVFSGSPAFVFGR